MLDSNLLQTLTIQFFLDHKRRSRKPNREIRFTTQRDSVEVIIQLKTTLIFRLGKAHLRLRPRLRAVASDH